MSVVSFDNMELKKKKGLMDFSSNIFGFSNKLRSRFNDLDSMESNLGFKLMEYTILDFRNGVTRNPVT